MMSGCRLIDTASALSAAVIFDHLLRNGKTVRIYSGRAPQGGDGEPGFAGPSTVIAGG